MHNAGALTGSENSSISSFKRMSGTSLIRPAIFCNISSFSFGFRPAFLGRASTLPVSRYNASKRVIALILTRSSFASRAWLAPSSLPAMILLSDPSITAQVSSFLSSNIRLILLICSNQGKMVFCFLQLEQRLSG
jgi:hypothetical protein